MRSKRFIMANGIVIKVTYVTWSDSLTFSSYFSNDELLSQVEKFFPGSIIKI